MLVGTRSYALFRTGGLFDRTPSNKNGKQGKQRHLKPVGSKETNKIIGKGKQNVAEKGNKLALSAPLSLASEK